MKIKDHMVGFFTNNERAFEEAMQAANPDYERIGFKFLDVTNELLYLVMDKDTTKHRLLHFEDLVVPLNEARHQLLGIKKEFVPPDTKFTVRHPIVHANESQVQMRQEVHGICYCRSGSNNTPTTIVAYSEKFTDWVRLIGAEAMTLKTKERTHGMMRPGDARSRQNSGDDISMTRGSRCVRDKTPSVIDNKQEMDVDKDQKDNLVNNQDGTNTKMKSRAIKHKKISER